MKKTLFVALIVLTMAAPAFAVTDTFDYPNGNLYGNDGWVKDNSTSWIAVVNGAVQIKAGDTGSGDRYVGNEQIAWGMTGIVDIGFDVFTSAGGNTLWGVWINDTAGVNLARFYGTTNNARGRLGGTSYVTSVKDLEIDEWSRLGIRIDTVANTSEFFVNGVSIGVLNHSLVGAGDTLGRVQFHKVNPGGDAGNDFYIDNLSINMVPEPSSFAALGTFGLAAFGFIRRRGT